MTKTATDSWVSILHDIDKNGKIVILPGNIKTLEIVCNSEDFDMNYPFIQHSKRRINYQFLAAEIEAILTGDNRVENLEKYNSNIAQFSDDGYIFNGAYGPPFNNQVYYAVNNLINDDTSRQSVISIWKPNPIKSKDIRCTLTLQFLIREGLIHTIVNMRSSDAIWGICYDFTVFTFMTLRILTLYNQISKSLKPVKLGTLFWRAGSSHIYDRHFDLVSNVLDYEMEDHDFIVTEPTPFAIPDCFITDWKAVMTFIYDLKNRVIPFPLRLSSMT